MREEELLQGLNASVELLDLYEDFLSSAQKEALNLYLRYDLSLGEIAEEKSISRAAAFDAVKKGLSKLTSCEGKLGLLRQRKGIETLLEDLQSAESMNEVKDLVKKYKEENGHGI